MEIRTRIQTRLALRLLAVFAVAIVAIAGSTGPAIAQPVDPHGATATTTVQPNSVVDPPERPSLKTWIKNFKAGRYGHVAGQPKKCFISAAEAKSGVFSCDRGKASNAELNIYTCGAAGAFGAIKGAWFGFFTGASSCAAGLFLQHQKK